MLRTAKRLLFGLGLGAVLVAGATPANAYYVRYYYYIWGPSGYAYFCDDGTYIGGEGLYTEVYDTVYYTGQPPC